MTEPGAELRCLADHRLFKDDYLKDEDISASFSHPIYYINVGTYVGDKNDDFEEKSVENNTLSTFAYGLYAYGVFTSILNVAITVDFVIDIGYCVNGTVTYSKIIVPYRWYPLEEKDFCELKGADSITIPYGTLKYLALCLILLAIGGLAFDDRENNIFFVYT